MPELASLDKTIDIKIIPASRKADKKRQPPKRLFFNQNLLRPKGIGIDVERAQQDPSLSAQAGVLTRAIDENLVAQPDGGR